MIRSVVTTCVLAIAATTAGAQTFTNPGTVTIPNSGNATPYPSTIGVVGGPASITSVTVRLNSIVHTFSGDLDYLLVGPGGQSVILLSDAGGGTNLVGDSFNITSASGAPQATFSPFAGGTYAPTNIGAGDGFGAPAPAGPYGADFAAFIGTNANGTWSLYLIDDAGGDLGTMSGWSITFNEAVSGLQTTSNVFTYQGKLTSGGAPVNGNVDLRFSFWRSAGAASPGNAVGSQPMLFNVPVTNGLFTAQVDPGDAFFDNKELWAEIEVRSPAGGGAWTTMSGRQRITPAPSAQWASTAGNALTANSATSANSAARLTSPDGLTNGVTTDNSGNVFVGGATGTIGAGNFILNGTQGTGAGFYGGMYITTPNANALPFYGYNTSSMTCWTYLDPASSMWRHNWGVNLSSAGNMGVGSDPVAGFKLAVNGALRCVGFTNASSQRYKTDVHSIDTVLDRFTQLRPVTFVWNEQAPPDVQGQKTTGLIAEEVYKLFPEAVSLDTQGRPDGIDYSRVTALSIQALKEMHSQQAAKDAELAALKARLDAIEKALQK